MQPIADLLAELSDEEKQFYERLILETPTHKCQNELYHLFKKNPELRENSFQLYPFIESVLKHDISTRVKSMFGRDKKHGKRTLRLRESVSAFAKQAGLAIARDKRSRRYLITSLKSKIMSSENLQF